MIRKAGAILRERSDEFARLMTEEMGKTLDDGRAEVEKCAFQCDWFADNAERYLARQPVDIGGPEAFVTFNPLGVVLAVMPWNFPFWQVFRFAAPALMAGNGALLKHASNVPGCALAIEDVFHQAGVPHDLFRTLLLPSSEVKALIEDDNVAAVTLTGSVAAGRSVATAAGGVLKKCVLELGGSDAYVILEDVDIEAAAKVAATARMVNGGQSCIAGKRFIVVRKILEQFENALVNEMRTYEMGDPRREGTRLGPMQSVHARDEIHRQVTESVRKGARLLLGGHVPDRPGAWYPATVLTNVHPGQPAHDEEVFGPVAAIIAAEDEARRDPNRQCQRVRPRLGRFDRRPRPRPADRGRGARGRHELRQRERPLRLAHAVRRGQAFGLRPRMLRIWDPRVRQHQERPREAARRQRRQPGRMISLR